MAGSCSGQRLALCWGSVEGGDLFDLAQAAARAGIVAIAVTPRHYLDQARAGLSDAQIRRRLGDLGVRVAVIDPLIAPMPGIPPLSAIAEPMRWLFEPGQADCWRAAAALEAEAINLTHFLGGPVEEAAIGERMARLAATNRAEGFATMIEFIPGTGVPDLITAARLTRDVADLSIMFDCWHYARSGGALDHIAALPPDAIGGVQINDWAPPEPGQPYVPMTGRLMPGDGVLPLAQILARIEANSPGLWVGIEVFNADLSAMPRDRAVERMAERAARLIA